MSFIEILSEETLSQLDGEGLRPVVRENSFVFRGTAHGLCRSLSDEGDSDSVLPRYLGSTESFQFLGFTQEMSMELAQRMRSAILAAPDMAPGMKEMVEGHFEAHPGPIAMRESDDWESAFMALGISKNISKALRNPAFADILLTKSSVGWAKHIAEENLYSLQGADKTIQQNLLAERARHTARDRRQDETSEESKAYRQPARPNATLTLEPPTQKPGYCMLFRAGILSRLQAATGLNADLRKALVVEELVNYSPCDFTPPLKHSIYTTLEYETAMRHAVYGQDIYRNPFGVGIITFCVPEAFLENQHRYEGEEWTRMVFGCRGNGKITDREWITQQWQSNQKLKVVTGRICGVNDEVLNQVDAHSHTTLKEVQMRYYPRGADPTQPLGQVGRPSTQVVISKGLLNEFSRLCYPSDCWTITEVPRSVRDQTAAMSRPSWAAIIE